MKRFKNKEYFTTAEAIRILCISKRTFYRKKALGIYDDALSDNNGAWPHKYDCKKILFLAGSYVPGYDHLLISTVDLARRERNKATIKNYINNNGIKSCYQLNIRDKFVVNDSIKSQILKLRLHSITILCRRFECKSLITSLLDVSVTQRTVLHIIPI